jgi:hypothetical protein
MASVSKDLGWLSRQTIEYRSYMDDAMGVVEDLDELGKHSRGFSSTDDLEKVDIGDGVIPRPTCKCASKHGPKTENNRVVEGVHALFCLGLHCDVDINTSDTSTPTHNQISGPITRARARQLNNQVSSFLASYSFYLDTGNMCSVLLLRSDGQE